MTKITDEKKSLRRVLTAEVLNVSNSVTVKVKVERKFPHPKYMKIIKTHKSYLAHISEDITVEKGDIVLIGEIKPISKRKKWAILEKIENK